MALRVTPLDSDADYAEYARLRNAWFPAQPTTGARMRSFEAAMPADAPLQRYLVRDGDEPLGAGLVMRPYWFEGDGLFETFSAPEPGEGFAARFGAIQHAMVGEVAALGAQRVRTMISTLRPEGSEWLLADGYVETDRAPVTMCRLDPTAPPVAPGASTLAAAGITIEPLDRWIERTGPDWKRRYWEFDMELSQDIPFDEQFKEMPFEPYCKQQFDAEFDPSLQFTAMAGDETVGMTMLFPNRAEPDLLNTGLTGVRAGWRRRGIARMLKQHSLAVACERGFRRVVTENSAVNPMLQLNVALGYRREYDEIVYSKAL